MWVIRLPNSSFNLFPDLCMVKELVTRYNIPLYTVFRKKHPLTFSFISPWIICGFKQKLQWIYPRIDRFSQCKNYIFIAIDDVTMTSHLSGWSWSEFTARNKPWSQWSFFASTGYLLVHRRGRIVYYMVEFKTIILTLNKFSFINLIKFDHHWR